MVTTKKKKVSAKSLKANINSSFWKDITVLTETESTNDQLKERAQSGAPEGTVIWALKQTAGRGRYNRKWYSPPGGAWFSFLLRPKISSKQAGCLAILVSAAIASGLNDKYSLDIDTKWPNDLIIGGKKLGGILIDSAIDSKGPKQMIVGTGLNVNNPLPEEVLVHPTSLSQEVGDVLDLGEVIACALNSIYKDYFRFLNQGFEPTIKKWKVLSAVKNKMVRVKRYKDKKSFKARVIGLSPFGELEVLKMPEKSGDLKNSNQLIRLRSEEVTLNVR